MVLQNKSQLKFKLNAIGKHGNWTNGDLVIFNQFTELFNLKPLTKFPHVWYGKILAIYMYDPQS